MTQTLYVAALALVLGCGLAAAASLTGTVVDDASGAAVSKPEVLVFGQRPPRIDATTKDDGTFQADDLRPGDYTVSVWSPGYVSTATSVHMGNEAGPLHIRLVRLGAIEGQLTGLQGWTASVLALTRSVDKKTGIEIWNPVLGNFARAAIVDSDGHFRIADLPPGFYSLLVAYSNSGVLRYPDGKGALELKGDGATARVQIPIPAGAAVRTVEGQVELPDPQSWYWVTLSDPRQPALAVATTISDDKGAFAFRGIVPGAYEVLAVPGEGERGTRGKVPYHGFARVAVDLRAQDVHAVKITAQQAIKVSVALQELTPMPLSERCGFAIVTLMPLEDWGVPLERLQGVVKIGNDGASLSPEAIDGLAPARYGVSVENGNACRVADNPVLDLANALAGSVEAKMREPGTVKGLAETGSEVILIPDDFTEGWSYLPAMWFAELPFGAGLHFREQANWGGGGSPPQVHTAVADTAGHFEFKYVPAGSYHIGLRSAGPAPDRQTMKQIDVPPAGIAEADLVGPDVTAPKPGSGQ